MPSDKPTVSVRLPEHLMTFVDRLAAEQDRSRNYVITDLISHAMGCVPVLARPLYEINHPDDLREAIRGRIDGLIGCLRVVSHMLGEGHIEDAQRVIEIELKHQAERPA